MQRQRNQNKSAAHAGTKPNVLTVCSTTGRTEITSKRNGNGNEPNGMDPGMDWLSVSDNSVQKPGFHMYGKGMKQE